MNLELVTTHALLDELESRYKDFVFMGRREHDPDSFQENFRYKGDYRVCQGMSYTILSRIEKIRIEDSEPLSEEDM